jgi:hypothetical protein
MMKILWSLMVLGFTSVVVAAKPEVISLKGILPMQKTSEGDSTFDLGAYIESKSPGALQLGVLKVEYAVKSKARGAAVFLVLNEEHYVDQDVVDSDEKLYDGEDGYETVALISDFTERIESAILLATPGGRTKIKDLKIYIGKPTETVINTKPGGTTTVDTPPRVNPPTVQPPVVMPRPQPPVVTPTPKPQPPVVAPRPQPRPPKPSLPTQPPLPQRPKPRSACLVNIHGEKLCEKDPVENSVGRPGVIVKVYPDRQVIRVRYEDASGEVEANAQHFIFSPL